MEQLIEAEAQDVSDNIQVQLQEVIKNLQLQLRDSQIELTVMTERFTQELNYSNKLAVELKKIQQHGA